MRFDSGTNTRLLADWTGTFDPTTSTVVISVDGVDYPSTWLSTPTSATSNGVTTWSQTAQTTGYFAGPQVAVPGAAVVLALGVHTFETRVTSGLDIIESPLASFRVSD